MFLIGARNGLQSEIFDSPFERKTNIFKGLNNNLMGRLTKSSTILAALIFAAS